ncbi:unnamed protein product [Diabrotica balteata]|uniref:Uncharacterized protein n=1 Tax=Diabrotica balteata TaxID=107213 RepID=A0A9N9T2G5_DIABA|nr:unnamed protein product [Diabrotica balteata]
MQKENRLNAKPHPPFLFATKKFATIGIHPSLDKTGSTKKKITDAGPGSYDPQPAKCTSKNGYSWKMKLESENFSKHRGHRNPELVKERDFQKTMRGPGTHEVNYDIFKRQCDSKFENVDLGAEKRFVDKTPNFPCANTYFRKFEDLCTVRKKQFSQTPTFEFDGFLDRFRLNLPRHLLPSNIYDYQDHDNKNIADIVKKVVSARGPYDLFTGPRDNTTIKNHFSTPICASPEYYYIKPSNLDVLLHHPSKSRTGKFLQGKRFTKPILRHILNDLSLCYRNPKDPGPASYNLDKFGSITEKPPNLHPFNTSKSLARPPPALWNIFPGPGRYNPKPPRCMKQKRASWVFLSKQNRQYYTVVKYSAF